MKHSAAVIDTNVVVAGLLTASADSPTAWILDGMCRGAFPFLLSAALLAEYREVLLRRKIRALHGLGEREVDILLTTLAANAIVREPAPRTGAPDPKDDHLWSLVQSETRAVLVTGDRALAEDPPPGIPVLAPRQFVELFAG
jgi:putative PIN family toxin of toxin-antitoxin system